MAKKNTMDLTKGNIIKELIVFSIPIILAQILQNLYNSFDAIIVGRNIGTEALAAVTSCSDISQLLVGFFTGLSTGSGVLFARYFGAKNYEKLHDSIHTAIMIAIIIGLTMAIGGIILAPVLLNVVACPADVYDSALIYLRVYLIGILFTAIYNVCSGVLRAVGDTKNPLYYLLVSCIVNIVLDYTFIAVLHIGVMGVAMATIISQLVALSLILHNMMSTTDVYKFRVADLAIDKQLAMEVVELGIPAGIQSALTSISNLFVQRYLNSFGKQAMAGAGAAKKLEKFVGLAGQSMGQALTTFVSQNLGAKNYKRAFQGIRNCLLINVIYVACVSGPLYLFSSSLVSIFTQDEVAISYGVSMLNIMLPLYICQMLNQLYAGATRGFGKSRAVMFLSLIGMIGARQVFLAISMNINWDVTNVFIGYPVGWFFSAVFVAIYYYAVIYRKYHKLALEQKDVEG